MQSIKILFIALFLSGVSLFSTYATFSHFGVEETSNPKGISLREDSVRRSPNFFAYYYGSRSHRGGGIRYGK